MTSDPEKVTQDGASQTDGDQGEAAAQPAAASPEQKLADAQAETAKLRDQLLRTAADFDNFRKRARREEADAGKRGREGLLKDLLPVFDNLERAVQHADGAQDVKAVADGLRMVLKQFVDTLDRSGIKRVPAVGQPFDPTKHEAIQHLESAQYPAGVVMAEVQPGYAIGDSLVRAALVVVSKGAPGGEAS
ncbi:Heat shock protein GrpE [Minicystis rosea]|nr:Heat shock protein GrpE [Minicystis rosea]